MGGYNQIAVLAKPAHPNAQKLYANWWLSREGQKAFQELDRDYQSVRTDLPRDPISKERRRHKGVDYVFTDGSKESPRWAEEVNELWWKIRGAAISRTSRREADVPPGGAGVFPRRRALQRRLHSPRDGACSAHGTWSAGGGVRMPGLKTAAHGIRAVGFAPRTGSVVMAVILGALGFYIVYPIFLICLNSFNVAELASDPPRYSLENWRNTFRDPLIFEAVKNTFLIFVLYTSVSFPLAVIIAWVLGRTNVPGAHWLEFGFWVSYLLPSLTTTIGWILLLHPQIGLLNDAVLRLGLGNAPPFNIYSVPGIVWAHLVGNAVSVKVMLLTPAFRNMDLAFEEAARVSGASKLFTFLRVTIPLMTPALVIVFMLNFVRLFQSFETEQLLGTPFGFFVYSTLIFRLIRLSVPAQYGEATALASITLALIALIFPLQRWLTQRKRFVTVSGRLRTGLIDLGLGKWPVFSGVAVVVGLLTVVPVAMLVLGTFMTRAGFWEVTPVFTFGHWTRLFSDNLFWIGLKTTLLLATASAIGSPLLFSILAYVLVRTPWKGRAALDALIWSSAALPGILSGLGLMWMFLGTPFLKPLYGTIVPLAVVVILSGKLLGVQLSKAVFLQMGAELEESARVSGAGWLRTYFRVWLPLLMPTLALLATINFVGAASAASTVILLATKNTMTLSILALSFGTEGDLEVASAISLVVVVLTLGVALVARRFGLKVGLRHQ